MFVVFHSDLHEFAPVQLSSAWWTRLCVDFFKLVNFATPVKSFASIFLGTFLAEKRSRVESSSAERVTPVATKSSRRFEPKKAEPKGGELRGLSLALSCVDPCHCALLLPPSQWIVTIAILGENLHPSFICTLCTTVSSLMQYLA